MSSWTIGIRDVARLSLSIIILVFLAVIATLIIDAVEILAAPVTGGERCGAHRGFSLFTAQGPQEGECQWQAVVGRSRLPRTAAIQVTEADPNDFKATAAVTASVSDPIVSSIRKGEAESTAAIFTEAVVGFVTINDQALQWTIPVIDKSDIPGKVVISVSGSELPASQRAPIPKSGISKVEVSLSSPGTVRITGTAHIVTRIQGHLHITSQSAHSVTAASQTGGGDLTADLATNAAQGFSGISQGVTVPIWLSRAASSLWQVLSGLFEALFPAIPWIVIFLASRAGAFGSLGQRAPWRRLVKIIGLALVADLVISAAIQISNQEGRIFPTSPLIESLDNAMIRSGLWAPVGYPPVGGSIIILSAIVLSAIGWPVSPLNSRKGIPGRFWISITTAGGMAVTLIAFFALAFFWASSIRIGERPGLAANPSALAVEIPLTALLLLMCIVLAATWFAGLIIKSPDQRRSLSQRVPRAQALSGTFMLVVSAVVISMAVALAFVYLNHPASVEPFYFWAAGVLLIVVVIAAITVLLTTHFLRTQRLRKMAAPIVLTSIILSLASAVVSYLIIKPSDNFTAIQIPAPALFGVLTLVAVITILAGRSASRPWREPLRGRPALLVSLIGILTVAGTTIFDGGYGPFILRWGVLGVAGGAMGLAALRLIHAGFAVRPLSKRLLIVLFPLTLLMAIPWGELHIPGVIVGWWDMLGYASTINGALGLVLIAAGCVALRRIGSAPVSTQQKLDDHRVLGIAAWFIALSSSYTFFGAWDKASVVTMLVAAIGAWFLLPAAQSRFAAAISRQSRMQQARAIRKTLQSGAGRRVIPALGKANRDKNAVGELTLAEAEKRITVVERQIGDYGQRIQSGGHTRYVTARQQGFGLLTSSRPWDRARWGLKAAIGIGAPWVILGLAGIRFPAGAQSYPELDLATAVAPLVIRWAGYGLLFGYFFPLLRGTTGLGKALWFAAVATAPAICATMASNNTTTKQWEKTVLLIIQVFAFAMTLGLLADRAVLHKYGIATARLTDLHNLWTVSAWASSVAVAVATGLATAIIVGLQPFVIGVITPSAPATPPAVVSHK